LQLYDPEELIRCAGENCAVNIMHGADGKHCTNDSSFFHHYQFGKQSTCSNCACVAAKSALPGSNGTEAEINGSTVSQHYSSYSKERSAAEGDTSYEEEMVMNESCSSSLSHSCHVVATESSRFNLCSPQPMSTQAAGFLNDPTLLKLCPADCLLSALCPDASISPYSQQPNIVTNSCRLCKTNAGETPRETGFQKALSSVSTDAAALQDADEGIYPTVRM